MKNFRFNREKREFYFSTGIYKVHGWLTEIDKYLIRSICDIQNRKDIFGSVGEIGVHHGKLFILMYLHIHDGEKAFCVDVFEKQEMNIDESGRGDEEIFHKNVQVYAGDYFVEAICDSSLNISSDDIRRKVGDCRLISIDGGHTKSITENDLNICEGAMSNEGVIIVDDYFNYAWPGVSEGVVSYFANRPDRLAPFAIGPNKVFICRPALHDSYRQAMREASREMLFGTKEFLDHQVDIYRGLPLGASIPRNPLRRIARKIIRSIKA